MKSYLFYRKELFGHWTRSKDLILGSRSYSQTYESLAQRHLDSEHALVDLKNACPTRGFNPRYVAHSACAVVTLTASHSVQSSLSLIKITSDKARLGN